MSELTWRDELRDAGFQRRLVWVNSAWPAALLALDWARGNLGANPAEALTRTSGVLTLVFLTLTLAVTPLSRYLHWPWLVKHRRALGLGAFFYGSFHFATYLGFDRGLHLGTVPADVAKRPFVLVGFLAWFLMVPLAVTSTNEMIRRLGGKRWKRLHRFTYVVALAGVVHYALIVKSDLRYPALFGVAIAALLLLRVPSRAGAR